MSKEKKATEEKKEVGVQFFDKTDKSWFIEDGENKLILCNSFHDLRNNKAEEFIFIQKIMSSRPFKNTKDEEKDKQHYVLFTLENGGFIIVKNYNELK